LCSWCLPTANAAEYEERYYPSDTDPFMGNWWGRWNEEEEVDPTIAGQVIPLGNDQYRVILKAKHDMRCPPKLDVVVEAKRGRLVYDERPWRFETDGETFTGSRGSKAAFAMRRVELPSPTLGLAPPEGATVLFDGSDLGAWQPSEWIIDEDGVLTVNPSSGDLVSRETFRSVRMHIEFRTPFMPRASGQQRGNSGVFFQDTFEVQVLDSYGLPGYYDECGALYKVSAPRVNACRPPMQWQTYDIEYHAPKFHEDGSIKAYPSMNVLHNGILVQKNEVMPWITGWKEEDREAPMPAEPLPIRLQDHGNYVQYRNIWVEEIDERD